MRKHGFLFALTAAVAVSLCGCGNVDGVSSSVNTSGIAEQTSSLMSGITESSADLSGTMSGLSADTSTENGNSKFPSKCKIYKASTVQFTEEQLFDFFNAHPECGTSQKAEYYSDDYLRYEADGYTGYISNGDNFYFSMETGNFYDDVHYYLTTLDNADKYMSADGDTDFATREEALNAVRNELSERFGIMPDDWWAYEFDAVKKEAVEECKQQAYRDAYEYEKVDENDTREKDKAFYEKVKDLPADDFYYFNIKYKADDLPIFQGGMLDIGGFETERAVRGTISTLVYGRNGIEYIIIFPAYKVDYSDYTEAELIPADQARGLIQKKYDELITETQVEVLDMNLSYLPIAQNDLGVYGTNFELRPHYGFYTTETVTFEGEPYTIPKITYFDAITGEELTSAQCMENIGREWGFDV